MSTALPALARIRDRADKLRAEGALRQAQAACGEGIDDSPENAAPNGQKPASGLRKAVIDDPCAWTLDRVRAEAARADAELDAIDALWARGDCDEARRRLAVVDAWLDVEWPRIPEALRRQWWEERC